MADGDFTTRFFVHRRYNMAPYRRYAFTVDYDESASAGYRIVYHDPIVADASYLAQFDAHMATPLLHVASGEAYRDIQFTSFSDLAPGSAVHYRNAVRTFGAALLAGRTPA